MTILVTLDVSQDSRNITFDLEDLECTEEGWLELSERDKKSIIQQAVDNMPEQPYWVVNTFSE